MDNADTESTQSSDSNAIELDIDCLCVYLDLPDNFPFYVEEDDTGDDTVVKIDIYYMMGQQRIGPLVMKSSIPMFEIQYEMMDEPIPYLDNIQIDTCIYYQGYEEKEREALCDKVKQWLEDSVSSYRCHQRTRNIQNELFSYSNKHKAQLF